MAALLGTSEDVSRMPAKRDPLSADEIALVKNWIDQGAKWPDEAAAATAEIAQHWAFRPPVRPAIPPVKNSAWAATDIDRFILARLETRRTRALAAGRPGHAAPPAEPRPDRPAADDRRGRRLPRRQQRRRLRAGRSSGCWPRPTTASAGAGTGSTRPATPTPTASRRTSRATSGSIATGSINALNRDLPYDQFIIEQLAGDLLPGATQDQIVATGFLRNSMINEEGGIDPEQFRMEAMFDRMDAIGKGILGLTIQCCQCHNHKFDPLTQEEYYRLFAFLNNDHEAAAAVYTPEEMIAARCAAARDPRDRSRAAARDARLARADGRVGEPGRDGQPRVGRARARGRTKTRPAARSSPAATIGSILAPGYAPTHAHVQASSATTKLAEHHRVPARAADRPEPAARRAGPLVQGHVRPDRVQGRSAAGRRADAKNAEFKLAKATADFDPPETPLEPIFDDRSSKQARRPARSRSPSTARTRPPGASTPAPGRRNQARKAVFVAREADRPSRRRPC